jgi:hypothetical protein
MDYPTVARRISKPKPRLRFQQKDVVVQSRQLLRDRQSDHSATNDDDVCTLITHR